MPLRYLKSALRQIARDFHKLTVHVTDADTSGKANASPISELASSISELASSISELRPVQRLHVTELASSIFELASSISELTSSIFEIPSSADFYRG
ncbi:hypothetical protein PS2_000183 [Malus domestica]